MWRALNARFWRARGGNGCSGAERLQKVRERPVEEERLDALRPLTAGQGSGPGTVGPELGFGQIMGWHHDEPVLILKASQGNRSLAWDFLPPGSERFEHGGRIYAGYKDDTPSWIEGQPKKPVNWYAGKQYDDCFSAAKALLADWDRSFPQFAGRDHEIAGFVWWQGHKDQGSAVHAARYEVAHGPVAVFGGAARSRALSALAPGPWPRSDDPETTELQGAAFDVSASDDDSE